MSFVALPSRLGKRRPARKTPRVDAEIVFKTFIRVLARLRAAPRAPIREKV
ncbi:hypothetical protein Ms3S1_08070 [Methylosinus sp. 3S-1]